MQKEKLEVKLSLSYKEAIAYIEDLLKSLNSGKIIVQKDDDFVAMSPPEQVMVELGAKVKKGKHKFSFEMAWAALESGGCVKITDKEPEARPDVPAKKEDTVPATKKTASVVAKETAPPAKKAAPKKPAAKKTAAKKAAAKKSPAKKPVTKPATKKTAAKKPPVKPAEKAKATSATEATPKATAVKPSATPMSKPTTTGTKP